MRYRSTALAFLFAVLCLDSVAPAQSTTDPTTSAPPQTTTTVQTQTTTASQPNQGDGFFHDWFAMVSETQSEQPHWITPLATTTPRLEQEFRYDIQTQPHNSGVVTDNYGVSKGLEIIPAKNFEVILAVPPYVVNNPDSRDGFGDWQFLVKYRIAAQNEEHGNYILTAFFQMSFPTGEHQQGVSDPVITPTFAYGKGFGNFDVQGTLGISLPTGNTPTIGRDLLWNDTFQYKIFKKFWPETEVNLTRYFQGEHNGNTVVYLTPGLVLGRFKLWDRLSFTVGGGYEIAVTSFHPTNHISILSIRFPF
jgi:hypothetical protein